MNIETKICEVIPDSDGSRNSNVGAIFVPMIKEGAMVDTVAVKFCFYIDPDELLQWEKITTNKPDGGYYRKYHLNTKLDNGAMVCCTYYPISYSKQPLLMVEFSLPKVITGKNINILPDLQEAYSQANEIISQIQELPPIDIRKGVINRIDICYNHCVGDFVPYYAAPLRQLKYPHRKTMPYLGEGVEYLSKNAKTKFYDKYLESHDPDAKGILRQEVTLRGLAIKNAFNKKKLFLGEITKPMLFDVLENELRQLEILDRSIGTRDTALKQLCMAEGELGGFFYYGMLNAGMNYPTKEAIASASKSHPRSLDRRLQKIAEAGVPLTLTETEEPLPPLKIERYIRDDSTSN